MNSHNSNQDKRKKCTSCNEIKPITGKQRDDMHANGQKIIQTRQVKIIKNGVLLIQSMEKIGERIIKTRSETMPQLEKLASPEMVAN